MLGTDLLFWTGGIVVLAIYAVAIYAAWWSLFNDRARGRRRCPRCWHDLGHTPGMTCGECGLVALHEREFARTRRRWTFAALAILACVGVAGAAYWRASDQGWASYLPTRVAIALLPFTDDIHTPVFRELSRRINRDRLTARHWSVLMSRCAAGDWGARPVSDEWIAKYGGLVSTRRRLIANDPELEWDPATIAKLLALPPQVHLSTRSVWPAGVTPRFQFRMREWWPPATYRIQVTPRRAGARTTTFYRSGRRLPWSGYSFDLDGTDLSGRSLEVEVEIERERTPVSDEPEASGPASPEWQLVTRRTITLETRRAEPGEPDLEPVDSTELAQIIGDAFRPGATRWSSGERPVRFRFNRQPTNGEALEDTAVGVRVEVLRGEDVARRLDIWWLAGPSTSRTSVGWEVFSEDLRLLKEMDDDDPAWSMRITGDRNLALRAGDATKYWSGQVTIPLRISERDEPAPPLPWWTEE